MLSRSSPTTSPSAEQLLDRFASGSVRQRRSLISTVESRAADLAELGPSLLRPFDPDGDLRIPIGDCYQNANTGCSTPNWKSSIQAQICVTTDTGRM